VRERAVCVFTYLFLYILAADFAERDDVNVDVITDQDEEAEDKQRKKKKRLTTKNKQTSRTAPVLLRVPVRHLSLFSSSCETASLSPIPQPSYLTCFSQLLFWWFASSARGAHSAAHLTPASCAAPLGSAAPTATSSQGRRSPPSRAAGPCSCRCQAAATRG
jgi:hypothetical protein